MTRVTQSMLSTNMLRNLNNSYSKMSKLENMITSGMKITRASDDPIVAVKGMEYRVQLDKVQQYQRNMNEANSWLDTTDTALEQIGTGLHRVKELIVQAANDTNTTEDRQKIQMEINQIREQVRDVANTQLGGKFIFSGTKTQTPTFKDGAINSDLSPAAINGKVEVEVFDGITLAVNTTGASAMFEKIDTFLGNVSQQLATAVSGGAIGDLLGNIADGTDVTLANMQARVLDARADVGARMNRVELMINRLEIQEINVTKLKSLNEDVDYAEAITKMTTQESLHQAALAVGAKIIQQTLVDFIR